MRKFTVGDVATMQRPVATISQHANIREAVALMRSRGLSQLLVADQDTVVGLISTCSLFERGLSADGQNLNADLNVAKVMDKISHVVTESTTLSEALLAFEQQGPVLPVAKEGKIIGLVTALDLLKLVAKPEAHAGLLTRAAEETEILLSTPVWQGLLNLLAEAGI